MRRFRDGLEKKQRVIRRHQLATSRDPQVREIHGRFAAFQHRKKTNALRHQWLECIYKSVKDRIKEATESMVETEVEDSVGFKSNLGKFTAPRAQSSQAPLLESGDDWKVRFDVIA